MVVSLQLEKCQIHGAHFLTITSNTSKIVNPVTNQNTSPTTNVFFQF